jgi:2-haloacid dehalogenase
VGSVSAVVFDIGGVLLDWDPRHFYRKLFGGDETAMEQFLTRVCSPQWHAAQDLGYGIAQACGELAARHRDQAELILAWAGHTEDMVAGSIAGSVAVFADLKRRGVSCYALSNMEAETFPLRLRKFSFLRWFDGYVISGLEGMAKPDPRIYRLLLQRYELLAAQTLLRRCLSTTRPITSLRRVASGWRRSASSRRHCCALSLNPQGCCRLAGAESRGLGRRPRPAAGPAAGSFSSGPDWGNG